ncbi:TetR family transcriptional regulator C-terminal domain-containing protein [Flavobacterium algicola]|uniref:TetR family transcriptional regulator C-terminal domain-containing protein n=1 Tax=Flavobacterium algicola TaxID=556529 RepID=UPI001EFC3876|nr:TetR family transcriptional regulator C-terminal domain-containing protein [Flavobacterium algicola]MCG9791075.1 TetR/AcrR family transcriptional regulator [Flavobacterium algicola]
MPTKNIKTDRETIISAYMEYTLENSKKPESVYLFTKSASITEADFYKEFGTLQAVDKEIFTLFFLKTINLINKDPAFVAYETKNKLLSFYFTFFEMLTMNRSYVLLTLKEHKNMLKNLSQLSPLRNEFKNFIGEIMDDTYLLKQEKVQEIQLKGLKESAWIQFLLTLKFWMEDESAAFEKTDIYIEKSVKLSFELINIAPLDSLIDFGKFLFKEKTQRR